MNFDSTKGAKLTDYYHAVSREYLCLLLESTDLVDFTWAAGNTFGDDGTFYNLFDSDVFWEWLLDVLIREDIVAKHNNSSVRIQDSFSFDFASFSDMLSDDDIDVLSQLLFDEISEEVI